MHANENTGVCRHIVVQQRCSTGILVDVPTVPVHVVCVCSCVVTWYGGELWRRACGHVRVVVTELWSESCQDSREAGRCSFTVQCRTVEL